MERLGDWPEKLTPIINLNPLRLCLASLLLLTACSTPGGDSQRAVALAQELYRKDKTQGMNFSNGPSASKSM